MNFFLNLKKYLISQYNLIYFVNNSLYFSLIKLSVQIKERNGEQPVNIQHKSLGSLVLKLERFNAFKDSHPKNIQFIFFTLSVLKLERFIAFNDKHL